MVKSESKQFGDIKVTVQVLPGMRALRMTARLGRIFGPALAKVFSGVKGSDLGNLADMEVGQLAAGLDTLFEKLTDDELESITRELLETAMYTNSSGKGGSLLESWDILTAGDMPRAFGILRFALTVNFGNFTVGVLRGGASPGATPAPSTSPTT